jgi:hypothetical protein
MCPVIVQSRSWNQMNSQHQSIALLVARQELEKVNGDLTILIPSP